MLPWSVYQFLPSNRHLCLNGVDQGQLGVTKQVVERAASYEQKLQRAVQDGKSRDLASNIRRLSEEYQAWRQERLDLAEILLARLSPEKSVIEPTVAESLADILLEIGRDQAAKQQYTLAIHWLEKAHDVLSSQTPESLSNGAGEIRSCILHTMIRVLLKERGEENIPKAWNIVQELEGESENRVAVSLLRLELFNIDSAATTQDYHDALSQVVRQIHITDTNLKTILHHIHELRRRSTRLTHAVLVVLLTERLLTIGEAVWMEKTLITIIWNFTTSSDLASTPDRLGDLFATMVTTSNLVLGTSATHAAQIVSVLILRRIEATYSQGDYGRADLWCCLALHDIFSRSGATNVGKLQSVLEAQKSGNRQQVILTLTRVCHKPEPNPTPGLHLLALLRYVKWFPKVI
ncbi:MAG: hypothetical protein L6R37_005473 [Teloschistes peruensis]|nr:MAG: hypothetical protein L6R37_005473 [Teloschistes peruensis]